MIILEYIVCSAVELYWIILSSVSSIKCMGGQNIKYFFFFLFYYLFQAFLDSLKQIENRKLVTIYSVYSHCHCIK